MNMDGKTVIVAGLGVSGQSMMEVLGSRAGRVLGVDEKKPDAVGAATVIHNSLMRLRSEGAGILVVSEEIDELFAICDRIAVMYRGSISPAIPVSSITTEELGRWMAGLWVGSPFRHGQSAAKEAE